MVSYMDPGAGSLLTQAAVAGVAGAAVAVKLGWRKVAALVDGRRHRAESDSDKTDASPVP